MHLRAPAFVRFLAGIPIACRGDAQAQPKEADWAYGPFASRAAAERYVDEALKLFLLRRCTEDLEPNPSHPGCVYSEMKMCLAPATRGVRTSATARRPRRSRGSGDARREPAGDAADGAGAGIG